jgi:hypothetical protein
MNILSYLSVTTPQRFEPGTSQMSSRFIKVDMVAYLNICKRLIAKNGYLSLVSLNLIISDNL